MPDTKLLLRILYTINSSPQYILARSYAPVPVSLVPPEQGQVDAPSIYGTASLKLCLTTICRSSPEHFQDNSRDYSVYVLDPLESNSAPAPVHISDMRSGAQASQNAVVVNQSRAVAVGLGLMSWALLADEGNAMSVVGTLYKSGAGQEALEVIFALRETVSMNKSSLPAEVASWGHPPAIPNSQPRRTGERSSTATNRINASLPVGPAASVSKISTTQTATTSNASSQSSTTVTTTLATLASIHMRTKAKAKPKKPPRPSTIPLTESDKLMNVPETYIGPLKKKGRPRTANPTEKAVTSNAVASGSGLRNHDKNIIVIDSSDASDGNEAPVETDLTNAESFSKLQKPPRKKRSMQNANTPPFSTAPLNRCLSDYQHVTTDVKVEPSEPSLLDVLALISATSTSEPTAQTAALLAALNSIDSSGAQQPSDAETNPALISALKQLLSVCANQPPAPPSSAQTPQGFSHHHNSSTSTQEDEIVLLDKENVNPTVFRRRSDRDCDDMKLGTSSVPGSLGAPFAESRNTTQSLGLGGKSKDNSSPKFGLSTSSNATNHGMKRKRTLSEFLDERESGRSSERAKERERVERRDSRRFSHSHRKQSSSPDQGLGGLRHYSRLLTNNQPRSENSATNYYRTAETCSSPPRISKHGPFRPQCEDGEPGSDFIRPITIPDSPLRARVSASSPVRSNAAQIQARRKYIVPEWARTSTATQPRLSEEAQRALEEAEEVKRKERIAGKKKAPVASQHKVRRPLSVPIRDESSQVAACRIPCVSRGPIAATSDFSVFPDIHTPNFTSRPSSPNKTFLPKTPVQQRPTSRQTPRPGSDSLFTPITSSQSAGSPLFSPLGNTGSPTSPLSNRGNAKLSPIRSVVLGKGVNYGGWNLGQQPKETQSNNVLEEELENAFEDLECPPSSLPIASSDRDIHEASQSLDESTNHEEQCSEDEEHLDNSDRKQHWAGLPPSSPPPPSPTLLAENSNNMFQTDDDEMEDLDLPVATSDTEVATPNSETEISSPNDDYFFSEDKLSPTYHEMGHSTALANKARDMDIFDQFTNVNAQSDDSQGGEGMSIDPSLDAVFQGGLEDIDFTEFWETFKPLIQDHATSTKTVFPPHFDFGGSDFTNMEDFADLDHAKLAEDVQALFSGCLM